MSDSTIRALEAADIKTACEAHEREVAAHAETTAQLADALHRAEAAEARLAECEQRAAYWKGEVLNLDAALRGVHGIVLRIATVQLAAAEARVAEMERDTRNSYPGAVPGHWKARAERLEARIAELEAEAAIRVKRAGPAARDQERAKLEAKVRELELELKHEDEQLQEAQAVNEQRGLRIRELEGFGREALRWAARVAITGDAEARAIADAGRKLGLGGE